MRLEGLTRKSRSTEPGFGIPGFTQVGRGKRVPRAEVTFSRHVLALLSPPTEFFLARFPF